MSAKGQIGCLINMICIAAAVKGGLLIGQSNAIYERGQHGWAAGAPAVWGLAAVVLALAVSAAVTLIVSE